MKTQRKKQTRVSNVRTKKCLKYGVLGSVAAVALMSGTACADENEQELARTIITTDLECDDMDSFMHMLLYSNELDIDGIVYSSSTHHWTGDGEHTMGEVIDDYQENGDLTNWRPMEIGWIEETIRNEYAQVYANLRKHDQDYPTPGELLELVKVGNVEFEGDMREATQGSDLIMQCMLDEDERTLYLQAWGGANTIGRALLSIEEAYKDAAEWNEIYQKVSEKTVIISFGDQDNTYDNYISVNWPDIKHLYADSSYGFAKMNAPEQVKYMFDPEWMMENIKFGHGALMSKYLLNGDGTYYVGETPENQFGSMEVINNSWLADFNLERYAFQSEGDSPCFMYLIPCGLRGLENRNYGSWGGRPTLKDEEIKEYNPTTGTFTDAYDLGRWLAAYMNDWAARADWCTAEAYEDANHQPIVTAEQYDFSVPAGSVVELLGNAVDPDGDEWNARWFVYADAQKYSGSATNFSLWSENTLKTSFTVPQDAQPGDYFNLVLEVTDQGAPALTRYAQVIITVSESEETEES